MIATNSNAIPKEKRKPFHRRMFFTVTVDCPEGISPVTDVVDRIGHALSQANLSYKDSHVARFHRVVFNDAIFYSGGEYRDELTKFISPAAKGEGK